MRAPVTRFLILMACFGLICGAAVAADPDAPPGAPATWLPAQPWVMDHWLPYDESRLYVALHTSQSRLLQWLGSHHDHAPLTELARDEGVRVTGLAARLIGPRPAGMPAGVHRLLIARAQLTLTQPHLIHHLLGHLMHVRVLLKRMPTLFGYPVHEIGILRSQGLTFAQIARRHGVAAATLRGEILALLTATQRRAVALHQTPATQAALWLSLQEKNLTSWLGTATPGALTSTAIASPATTVTTSGSPAAGGHAAAGALALLCHLLD